MTTGMFWIEWTMQRSSSKCHVHTYRNGLFSSTKEHDRKFHTKFEQRSFDLRLTRSIDRPDPHRCTRRIPVDLQWGERWFEQWFPVRFTQPLDGIAMFEFQEFTLIYNEEEKDESKKGLVSNLLQRSTWSHFHIRRIFVELQRRRERRSIEYLIFQLLDWIDWIAMFEFEKFPLI